MKNRAVVGLPASTSPAAELTKARTPALATPDKEAMATSLRGSALRFARTRVITLIGAAHLQQGPAVRPGRSSSARFAFLSARTCQDQDQQDQRRREYK